MSTSKLMKVTYYDPKSQIRLLCYADTVVWDTKPTPTLTALRFACAGTLRRNLWRGYQRNRGR